jgi:hypothetical protein
MPQAGEAPNINWPASSALVVSSFATFTWCDQAAGGKISSVFHRYETVRQPPYQPPPRQFRLCINRDTVARLAALPFPAISYYFLMLLRVTRVPNAPPTIMPVHYCWRLASAGIFVDIFTGSPMRPLRRDATMQERLGATLLTMARL